MTRRLALSFVVAAVALASCAEDTDPTPNVDPENLPAGWVVLDSPEDFSDIASSCIQGFRVFISKDDVRAASSIFVVADATCGEPS